MFLEDKRNTNTKSNNAEKISTFDFTSFIKK